MKSSPMGKFPTQVLFSYLFPFKRSAGEKKESGRRLKDMNPYPKARSNKPFVPKDRLEWKVF